VAAIDAEFAVNVAAASPDVPAGVCVVDISFAELASEGPTLTVIGRIQLLQK
jgi:hypothetical protein